MFRILLLVPVVFISLAMCGVGAEPLPGAGGAAAGPGFSKEVMRLLAAGDQVAAEKEAAGELAKEPENLQCLFQCAVLTRSRFDQAGEAAALFQRMLKSKPETAEGQASACVLVMDGTRNEAMQLYFYGALVTLCAEHPDSAPLHWLAGIMTRQITKYRGDNGTGWEMGRESWRQVLSCGVREYEKCLALLGPGATGPCLVHQTMANLYDDLEEFEAALSHREIALKQERTAWSMDAMANTMLGIGRNQEAADLEKETIAMDPKVYRYYNQLGKAYWRLGKKKEAMELWTAGAKIVEDDPYVLQQWALHCKNEGNYTQARDLFRQALKIDSDDRVSRIWEARLSAMLGDAEACARLRTVGDINYDGKPLDDKVKDDEEPWMIAAETCDMKKVKELMATEDINKHCGKYSQTALMIAACRGYEPLAAELIKAGAKLDEVDVNGDTALHYSAQFDNARVMKLLVAAGAKTDLQDKWKQTPLSMCGLWHPDGFEVLITAHPDTSLATSHGGSPLHYAAGHGDLFVVQGLLANGADANAVVKNTGDTPMIAACDFWQHSYIVTPLLKAGAKVNMANRLGQTALLVVIDSQGDVTLAKRLLADGADPTIADKKGLTPINKARLLGYDALAAEMEKKAGKTEAFHMPEAAKPRVQKSKWENVPPAYSLPFRMAAGFVTENEMTQSQAKQELRNKEGIGSTATLRNELHTLSEMLPDPGMKAESTDGKVSAFTDAARKIFAASGKDATGQLAWKSARIMYLSWMGVNAGYLQHGEAETINNEALALMDGKYQSWKEFLNSFMVGIRAHDAWEAERYACICRHIEEAGVEWPVVAAAAPAQ